MKYTLQNAQTQNTRFSNVKKIINYANSHDLLSNPRHKKEFEEIIRASRQLTFD